MTGSTIAKARAGWSRSTSSPSTRATATPRNPGMSPPRTSADVVVSSIDRTWVSPVTTTVTCADMGLLEAVPDGAGRVM